MSEPVVPIQTILFQTIFLLVAIALEARVLQRKLYLTRRRSIEYATSINLLAVVLGWFGFFLLQEWLPQPLKLELLTFIFFDRFLEQQPHNLLLMIVSTGIVIFFSAFIIKLKGLQLLEALLETAPEKNITEDQEKEALKLPRNRRRKGLSERLDQAVTRTDPTQATAVLLANAYSHSAILLILALRYLQIKTL